MSSVWNTLYNSSYITNKSALVITRHLGTYHHHTSHYLCRPLLCHNIFLGSYWSQELLDSSEDLVTTDHYVGNSDTTSPLPGRLSSLLMSPISAPVTSQCSSHFSFVTIWVSVTIYWTVWLMGYSTVHPLYTLFTTVIVILFNFSVLGKMALLALTFIVLIQSCNLLA